MLLTAKATEVPAQFANKHPLLDLVSCKIIKMGLDWPLPEEEEALIVLCKRSLMLL